MRSAAARLLKFLLVSCLCFLLSRSDCEAGRAGEQNRFSPFQQHSHVYRIDSGLAPAIEATVPAQTNPFGGSPGLDST